MIAIIWKDGTLTYKNEDNIITVKRKSSIGRILSGETRGYYGWYVREILTNKNLYKIID